MHKVPLYWDLIALSLTTVIAGALASSCLSPFAIKLKDTRFLKLRKSLGLKVKFLFKSSLASIFYVVVLVFVDQNDEYQMNYSFSAKQKCFLYLLWHLEWSKKKLGFMWKATGHLCLRILGYRLIIKYFLVPLDYGHFISWTKKPHHESKKGGEGWEGEWGQGGEREGGGEKKTRRKQQAEARIHLMDLTSIT